MVHGAVTRSSAGPAVGAASSRAQRWRQGLEAVRWRLTKRFSFKVLISVGGGGDKSAAAGCLLLVSRVGACTLSAFGHGVLDALPLDGPTDRTWIPSSPPVLRLAVQLLSVAAPAQPNAEKPSSPRSAEAGTYANGRERKCWTRDS